MSLTYIFWMKIAEKFYWAQHIFMHITYAMKLPCLSPSPSLSPSLSNNDSHGIVTKIFQHSEEWNSRWSCFFLCNVISFNFSMFYFTTTSAYVSMDKYILQQEQSSGPRNYCYLLYFQATFASKKKHRNCDKLKIDHKWGDLSRVLLP